MNYNNLLQKIGGETLLNIQKKTLNAVKKESNIALFAPTGSGKTLAYIFGLLEAHQLNKWRKAIIITPTRELAIQVYEVFKSLKIEQFTATLCYGGHAFSVEKNNLSASPDIIIGTPGRIADHLFRNSLDFKTIDAIVVDEEDKIYEIGFQKEMDIILNGIGNINFSIQVSATGKINKINKNKDVYVIDERKKSIQPIFEFYKVDEQEGGHKALTLLTLLNNLSPSKTLVFFNHRDAVERIKEYLVEHHFDVTTFHGGLDQQERERNLIQFSNGSCDLMLVTDLAARGIDVDEIQNIIHYQFPKDENVFIHRNGRTARMGNSGSVFCIIDEVVNRETTYLKNIHFNSINLANKTTQWKTEWVTLYFSLGKKDKVNKVDFIGFLTKEIEVSFDAIGKINSLDNMTYVAMKKSVVKKLLELSKGKKIKKKTVKIRLSY